MRSASLSVTAMRRPAVAGAPDGDVVGCLEDGAGVTADGWAVAVGHGGETSAAGEDAAGDVLAPGLVDPGEPDCGAHASSRTLTTAADA
jgi:cytosine/adenosine deaminase-related metal-dependent hydrolase